MTRPPQAGAFPVDDPKGGPRLTILNQKRNRQPLQFSDYFPIEGGLDSYREKNKS
ncbi:hypothetical protein [Rhizobium sp. PP-CC-3G-465]|uniref:hypothetical protein n=1 Tax=Rhizobium sp. PP-CC-3G-465 TaxID=2135648 RepID=UPI0014045F4E